MPDFVHLRSYKYYELPAGQQEQQEDYEKMDETRKDHSLTQRWRCYLEFAPYGTLDSLISKYRYWNTYLPEPFLWHVFASLVETVIQMDQCEWEDIPLALRSLCANQGTGKVVNFDIKPTNIFLSYPDHRLRHGEVGGSTSGGTSKYDYPVIKLGDFGICEWTDGEDERNPSQFVEDELGTACFRPPEQVQYGIAWEPIVSGTGESIMNWSVDMDAGADTEYLDDSSILVDGERVGHLTGDVDMMIQQADPTPEFLFDKDAHVWAIGKVMYDLVSLAHDSDYWKASTINRSEFIRNRRQQIADFDWVPFRHSQTARSPYTRQLTDLVAACLRPLRHDRIALTNLTTQTSRMMREWDGRYTRGCDDFDPANPPQSRDYSRPKLFYRNNDIVTMPRGPEKLVKIAADSDAMQKELDAGIFEYLDLQHRTRSHPDWPTLKPQWDDQTLLYRREQGDTFTTHQWFEHLTQPSEMARTFVMDGEPTGGLERNPSYEPRSYHPDWSDAYHDAYNGVLRGDIKIAIPADVKPTDESIKWDNRYDTWTRQIRNRDGIGTRLHGWKADAANGPAWSEIDTSAEAAIAIARKRKRDDSDGDGDGDGLEEFKANKRPRMVPVPYVEDLQNLPKEGAEPPSREEEERNP